MLMKLVMFLHSFKRRKHITNSKNENPSVVLISLKNKNNDRLVIGHININALENKFEPLVSLVKDKLDIVLISETNWISY